MTALKHTPKVKAKPKKIIRAKTPPRDGATHERMRKASKPNPRSKKTTHQRMREASKPQRRRAMTDNAQQGNNMSASAQGAPKPVGNKPPGTEAGSPKVKEARRGAGSGADANETRNRSLVSWPPEPKPHAQHVEELLQQAQDNEDYNNGVNKAMTEVTANAREIIGQPIYPLDAEGEQESRDQVLQEYKDANDPALRKKRLEGEMAARAKRDEAQVKRQLATK